MTKQCFINGNYIYNPIEKQRVLVISGYLSVFHMILVKGISEFSRKINICYSPAGRSLLGEPAPEVLSTARGRGPMAVLRPRAQFLPRRTDVGRVEHFYFFPTVI